MTGFRTFKKFDRKLNERKGEICSHPQRLAFTMQPPLTIAVSGSH
jgi:hypothetical protein